MSTSQAFAAGSVQLRMVAISAIVPIEGWNPRMAFDDAELRALSASMLERGCLVPLLVQATGEGTYRLVDGEKRYKAAVLAALTELPAIVRPVDAGADELRGGHGHRDGHCEVRAPFLGPFSLQLVGKGGDRRGQVGPVLGSVSGAAR
jgi:ParB-like nuclease domain